MNNDLIICPICGSEKFDTIWDDHIMIMLRSRQLPFDDSCKAILILPCEEGQVFTIDTVYFTPNDTFFNPMSHLQSRYTKSHETVKAKYYSILHEGVLVEKGES